MTSRRTRAAQRPRSARSARRAAPAALAALAAGYVGFTGCDYNQYAGEATFCDDWCRVLRRRDCGQEPENCVRDCESARPSDRCLALEAALLDCYERVPPDRFECVGQGFQSSVRPLPEICTEQRHDLIGCEVPRVMQCIDACLAIEAASPAASGALDAGGLEAGALGGAVDPGAGLLCPEPPFPCERLCWELDARFGRGAPTTLRDVDHGDDTDLRAIGEPLIRCALDSAAACRSGALAQDSPAISAGRLSWTSAFLACAGLPADLDLDELE